MVGCSLKERAMSQTFCTIDNPDPNRWYRRVLTIPLAGGLLLLLPLLIVVLPISILIDVISRRTTFTRALLFIGLYIVNQNIGLLLCGLFWLDLQLRGRYDVFIERNHHLQHWWAKSLLQSLQRLFQFQLCIEGEMPPCGGKILFVRHVSSADTLLPLLSVIIPQRLKCHYVLKKELCWDPCLDIVAHRLPNAIVQRGQGEAEVERIIHLLNALDDTSCIVFYPEGTRFSIEKRQKVIQRLQEKKSKVLPLATTLQCCLPPRLGGSLGLLSDSSRRSVVFMAHSGFEVVENIGSLINGGLYQQQIKIKFWEDTSPIELDRQEEWLYLQWRKLDDWLISLT